jgi:hypothetical protein
MDENDVAIGTACMKEVIEVLKKHGCVFDVRVTFSSVNGPSFHVIALPQKNIVLANQMPKIKIGDN